MKNVAEFHSRHDDFRRLLPIVLAIYTPNLLQMDFLAQRSGHRCPSWCCSCSMHPCSAPNWCPFQLRVLCLATIAWFRWAFRSASTTPPWQIVVPAHHHGSAQSLNHPTARAPRARRTASIGVRSTQAIGPRPAPDPWLTLALFAICSASLPHRGSRLKTKTAFRSKCPHAGPAYLLLLFSFHDRWAVWGLLRFRIGPLQDLVVHA